MEPFNLLRPFSEQLLLITAAPDYSPHKSNTSIRHWFLVQKSWGLGTLPDGYILFSYMFQRRASCDGNIRDSYMFQCRDIIRWPHSLLVCVPVKGHYPMATFSSPIVFQSRDIIWCSHSLFFICSMGVNFLHYNDNTVYWLWKTYTDCGKHDNAK